jgi:hypothetical protein
MIFSVPSNKLRDLILGLRHLEKLGQGYTRYAPDMKPDYRLSDLYAKVSRMAGMDVDK